MPSTSNSALYSGSGSAIRPPTRLPGARWFFVEDTQPVAELGEAGDKRKLFDVPDGLELVMLLETHGDMDTNASPTLDLDIVLVDDNGTTILYNAGAAYQAAVATPNVVFLNGVRVKGNGHVAMLVNVAAATPAAVPNKVYLLGQA